MPLVQEDTNKYKFIISTTLDKRPFATRVYVT